MIKVLCWYVAFLVNVWLGQTKPEIEGDVKIKHV